MDKLTLIALTAQNPRAPLLGGDGDSWHAQCLLEFVDRNAGFRSTNATLQSAEPTDPDNVVRQCFSSQCTLGRTRWTS